MLLSLTTCAVYVAKAWVCGATGMLMALPWQDVSVPGQVVELMSRLELPPEKDPPSFKNLPGLVPGGKSYLKKKKKVLTSLLGWVPELLRLWLVRAEARCQLPVSQDSASQLGLSG